MFHQTWWVENPSWPNGLEPCLGRRKPIAKVETEEEARELCREWNRTHKPGRLSDKAEYEEA